VIYLFLASVSHRSFDYLLPLWLYLPLYVILAHLSIPLDYLPPLWLYLLYLYPYAKSSWEHDTRLDKAILWRTSAVEITTATVSSIVLYYLLPHQISVMDFPFPVHCINCNYKQLECKASSQSKGSCHHCLLNGVKCFFPVVAAVAASATVSAGAGVFPIQRNCFHCTQSHQQCHSSNRCQSQCSRCTKRGLPIVYKLSSQGQRNDL